MKKAVYLKVNRTEDFALRNLARWLEACFLINADIYIICDKEELTENIKHYLHINNAVFLLSRRTGVHSRIVSEIIDDHWKNAAYAHLTTFVHAAENGYECFWNIDADDTFVCLSTDRIAELLIYTEKYAEDNDIALFSLDMWKSKTLGKHWSFGVTYTNGKIDWMKVMFDAYMDYGTNYMHNEKSNIDWLFTYLENKRADIGTFYFENLKFIHYADDFFYLPLWSGLCQWKENILISHIPYHCFGDEDFGNIEIDNDVIKLDINISDEETTAVLKSYIYDSYYFVIPWGAIRKVKNKNMNLTAWGAGHDFESIYNVLRPICDINFVVDNDPKKWGKDFYGIKCVSPEELKSMKNMAVIITSITPKHIESIHNQLTEIGIEEIIHLKTIDFLKQ